MFDAIDEFNDALSLAEAKEPGSGDSGRGGAQHEHAVDTFDTKGFSHQQYCDSGVRGGKSKTNVMDLSESELLAEDVWAAQQLLIERRGGDSFMKRLLKDPGDIEKQDVQRKIARMALEQMVALVSKNRDNMKLQAGANGMEYKLTIRLKEGPDKSFEMYFQNPNGRDFAWYMPSIDNPAIGIRVPDVYPFTPDGIVDMLKNDREVRSSFVHEFQHFLDFEEFSPMRRLLAQMVPYANNLVASFTGSQRIYYNSFHEIQAHYQQAIFKFEDELDDVVRDLKRSRKLTPEQKYERAVDELKLGSDESFRMKFYLEVPGMAQQASPRTKGTLEARLEVVRINMLETLKEVLGADVEVR